MVKCLWLEPIAWVNIGTPDSNALTGFYGGNTPDFSSTFSFQKLIGAIKEPIPIFTIPTSIHVIVAIQ